MNYRPQAFFLLITSTVATLFVSIIIARAQTLTLQENTPSPIPSPFSKPTPILDATLTALETKVDGLDEQLNNPPKDIWDKIDAISGLISGVLIAVIGGIATYIYREREKASQEAQRKRENAINEVQTIQGFMPYLLSDNPKQVTFALLAEFIFFSKNRTNVL